MWCDISVAHLIHISGKPPPKDPIHAPKRGRPPLFYKKRVAAKTAGCLYGAGTHESDRHNTMAQRAKDLEVHLRHMDYPTATKWANPELQTTERTSPR